MHIVAYAGDVDRALHLPAGAGPGTPLPLPVYGPPPLTQPKPCILSHIIAWNTWSSQLLITAHSPNSWLLGPARPKAAAHLSAPHRCTYHRTMMSTI